MGELIISGGGIFNDIVKQRCDDGVLVQAHFKSNLRGSNTMRHVRGAVFPQLAFVSSPCIFICGGDAVDVHCDISVFHRLFQRKKHGVGIQQIAGSFAFVRHFENLLS